MMFWGKTFSNSRRPLLTTHMRPTFFAREKCRSSCGAFTALQVLRRIRPERLGHTCGGGGNLLCATGCQRYPKKMHYRWTYCLFLFLVQWLVALPAVAQLDATLLRQVENWKIGEPPPKCLLKFPDGKIDEFPICGMRTLGTEVADYISQIKNPDLLAALLLDNHAQPDTLRAAATQLIMLKGTEHVARLLASHGRESQRSELAVLAELLRSPYSAIQVARITKDDMELAGAESALQEMRADLDAGTVWAEAYRKAADKHPDLKDRAKDPRSVRTVVCYLYDGIVSPTGFDILRYAVATGLPPQHLQEIFRAARGTYVLKTSEAVYLYHMKSQ